MYITINNYNNYYIIKQNTEDEMLCIQNNININVLELFELVFIGIPYIIYIYLNILNMLNFFMTDW